MSSPSHRPSPFTDDTPGETRARLRAYLREHVDGTAYFKSKSIGADLDLSAKEVGSNMRILQERSTDVDIEQWGSSPSTTWKVTR